MKRKFGGPNGISRNAHLRYAVCPSHSVTMRMQLPTNGKNKHGAVLF
jgi:hypothetical protein